MTNQKNVIYIDTKQPTSTMEDRKSRIQEVFSQTLQDLNIKGILKNHCLAKSISDAAWNKLITSTKYKAESAGTIVVLFNPANTSKMCSRCGLLV